jgi:meso-butanediol dehydrogenase/(S,S)-butanediol dehydrogenase/diacetyl reductase
MRLPGEVALVSGSTRGIGRSIAEMFAAEGAKVAITGRTEAKGEKVVARIREAGGEAEFFRLDVTDEANVRDVIEATVDRFGSLTVLVNNAAPTDLVAGTIKPVWQMPTEEWEAILRGTLTGNVFWATKYGVPHLIAAGGGSIINISSGQSVIGFGGFGAYGAAKAGINSLTRSVAVEAAPHHIRCNCIVVGRVIAPGDTSGAYADDTLTRLGVPNDIAYAATWLASKEAAFVTGSLVTVDGGMTINKGTAITSVTPTSDTGR